MGSDVRAAIVMGSNVRAEKAAKVKAATFVRTVSKPCNH
jgi:hypothetical protein